MATRYAAYDYDDNSFLTTATFADKAAAEEYADQFDNGIVIELDVPSDVEDPGWEELDDEEDDEFDDEEDDELDEGYW